MAGYYYEDDYRERVLSEEERRREHYSRYDYPYGYYSGDRELFREDRYRIDESDRRSWDRDRYYRDEEHRRFIEDWRERDRRYFDWYSERRENREGTLALEEVMEYERQRDQDRMLRDRRETDQDHRQGIQRRRDWSRDRSPRRGGQMASEDISRERSPRYGGHMPSQDISREGLPRDTGRTSSNSVQLNEEDSQEQGWSVWKADTATDIVMLTGLPLDTKDVDIYQLLYGFHARVTDVTINCSRTSCDSNNKGFGFVEFLRVEDAKEWMEKTQKTVTVGENKVTLYYSRLYDNKPPKPLVDTGWMKWASDEPSSSLVIWNVPVDVTSSQLQEIVSEGYNIHDCKLIKRAGGSSCGYGFLDFADVGSAMKWLNDKKGVLVVSDSVILATFSCGAVQEARRPWICFKCGKDNFKRREFCFKCGLTRTASENCSFSDGADQMGLNPCNTLIFRGLDTLTTEETLTRALQWITGMLCKNVYIMRDTLTKVSMSYGFGEMASISEAKKVLEFLSISENTLEVDGKQVLVSFAKNTYSTIMATQLNVGQQTSQVPSLPPQTVKPVQQPEKMIPTTEESPATDNSKKATPGLKKATGPKKEMKSKKNPVANKMKKSTGREKEDYYLEVNMQKLKGYFYDPNEDKYYSSKIKRKCPVSNCKLRRAVHWMNLRKHWRHVHVPTKKSYLCPRYRCKSSNTAYRSIQKFFRHLESHPDLKGEQYENELSKAKVKLLPNTIFIDPGNTVLPAPTLKSPKLDIPETECPVKACPHTYTTLVSMKEHWAKFHSANITMYRCGVCDTIDREKKVMIAHVEEKHSDTDTTLEKVVLESKQYIDPGNVLPFWSLYADDEEDDDGDDSDFNENNDIEDKLGPNFSLTKIPSVGSDPEDICEFLTWTERYMHRIQQIQRDAVSHLQNLANTK